MTEGKYAWLTPFSWAVVTAQNKVLCEAKGAYHGPPQMGMTRPVRCGRKLIWPRSV
jgi:hypothetical protein